MSSPRRDRRTAAALAGAVLFLQIGVAQTARGAAALPPEKDAWIEVQTPHFTLYSDASESKTKDIGLDLERFRGVLLLLRDTFQANAPVPTFVFVLKSESAMRPYLPVVGPKPRQSAGYFQATSDGNYIVLCAAWNTDPRPIVYHEYLHFFLHNNFPPQPLWYDEGLAEFYRTFHANDKEAEIGRPIPEHIFRLRENPPMSLQRLFRVGHESPEYNEEPQAGLFYAESWALVHYLMRGEPNRTAQLGRFLVRLQQGVPEDSAFREAFGTDYGGLFSQLVAYVRGAHFRYTRLSFADLKVTAQVEVRRLDSSEALFRLGDLLAHESEERFGAAETYLETVLSRHPSHPGALTALGWLRIRQERYEEAAALLEKALASGAADYRAHFHYGDLLLRSLAEEPIPVGHLNSRQRRIVEDARRVLRGSIALDSDFAEAYVALGRSYLVEDACAWEGIAPLETAARKLPSREDVALDLARLYERSGEVEKSDRIFKTALGPEAAKVLMRERTDVRFARTVERAQRLLADRKEDEAIALCERFLSGLPEDSRAPYERELAALRRGAARSRAIAQYNDAVRLLNVRDLHAALDVLEKVAFEAEDADLAKAAAQKAEEIRRSLRTPRAKHSRGSGA